MPKDVPPVVVASVVAALGFVGVGCEGAKPNLGRAASAAATASNRASPPGPAGTSDSVHLTQIRATFMKRLARAVDEVAATPKKRTKCPAKLKQDVHVYALAFARSIAKGAVMSRTAEEMTAFRPPSYKLLLGDSSLPEAGAEGRLRRLLERAHLAIVRTDKLVLPSTDEGKSFLAGEFDGWVYIVDLARGNVSCAAPFSFISSEKVEWTESLSPAQAAQAFDIDKSDAAFHVRVDFFIQGHRALEKAISSVGPGLTLDLRGKPQ